MDATLITAQPTTPTFARCQSSSKSAPIVRSPTPTQPHSHSHPQSPISSPHPSKAAYTYTHANVPASPFSCNAGGILRSPKPIKPAFPKSHSESCFLSPSRPLFARFLAQADSSDPESLAAQPRSADSVGSGSGLLSPLPASFPPASLPAQAQSTAAHEDLCAGEEVFSIFTRPQLTQPLVSPSPRSRFAAQQPHALINSPAPAAISTAIRRIDFGTPGIPSIAAIESAQPSASSATSPVKKAHAAKQHLQKLKVGCMDSCLGYESSSSPTSESAAGLSPGQFVAIEKEDQTRGRRLFAHSAEEEIRRSDNHDDDNDDDFPAKLLSCSPPCRDLHPLLFESRFRVSSPFSHTFLSWSPAPEDDALLRRPAAGFSTSSSSSSPYVMGVGGGAFHYD